MCIRTGNRSQKQRGAVVSQIQRQVSPDNRCTREVKLPLNDFVEEAQLQVMPSACQSRQITGVAQLAFQSLIHIHRANFCTLSSELERPWWGSQTRVACGRTSCSRVVLLVWPQNLQQMIPACRTDFRNVGKPVQSGCYPHTKIFIGIDSLQTALVDKKGRVRYDGLSI